MSGCTTRLLRVHWRQDRYGFVDSTGADGGGIVTRVLVVDDDVHARTVARAILEHAGFDVVEAVDGAAGLRAYREVGADVVLTDLFMPDVDGLEVIRELCLELPGVTSIATIAGRVYGTVD